MKIERIEVLPIRLPLKSVLTLARGVSRTIEEGKQIALVKITGDDGTVGWGEAGPSRRWSAETTHSTVTTLRHYLAPQLIGRDPFDIAGLHRVMDGELAPGFDPGQPISKGAIDMAVHDLICKSLGINLQTWLGSKQTDRVELAYLVSQPGPEETIAAVQSAISEGFNAFKVKVGNTPEHDVRIVRAVQEAAPGAIVWADANQGYDLDSALRAARLFEDLGLTLFEQPIPMTNIYGLKKLLSATSMNIALDEAAMGLPLVIDLIRRDAVEGLVCKVQKVGGIHYARQLCDIARNAGIKLIGSGLMDAPIGFAASVHVFAAYGIDYPVDLNGPQHLADDYLKTPLPREGQMALVPSAPGLGCDIDEDRVRGELALKIGD